MIGARWTLARRTTALAFLVLLFCAGLDQCWWLRGSTAGTRLLNVLPFADPLAALEVTAASRELTGDLLLGAGSLVLLASVFGPVFCGWLCPLGVLLDLSEAARSRLAKLLRRSPDRQRTLPIAPRYVLLGAAAGFSFVAGWPVFQTLSPVHAVGWLAALRLVTPLLLLVLAIVVLERWLRRLWCRSLCPHGGLLSLLARYAVLRVRVRAPRMPVAPCRRCTLACPVGIQVMEDHVLAGRDSVGAPECIRCGACVDACPRGVLRLGFRAGRGVQPGSDSRS